MIYDELIIKMTEFNAGDPKRIQHFIKVYEFAHVIGVKEQLEEQQLRILDMASIMHDIGIRPSEMKYGRCDGKLQEKEGPSYAREILVNFPEVSDDEIERICYLIAHHHTYDSVDGLDYRILLEADFLVNAMEDDLDKETIIAFRDKVFETKTGLHLINTMFGLKSMKRGILEVKENNFISNEYTKEELLNNINCIHTTELGAVRIKKNLSLETDDVVEWCKKKIQSSDASIKRKGKNWYVNVDNCVITVNAYSYTIITAHKEK